MTKADALEFGWAVAGPLVAFVMFVAVILLGFSILRDIGR